MSESGEAAAGSSEAVQSGAEETGGARQYGDVAAVYDALMAGVPHAAWLSRIEKEARDRGKSPRSALDVACGTGIVTSLLYRRGYRPVLGVDLSPQMIDVARTKAAGRGEEIAFQVQNAATMNVRAAGVPQTFDLIVSLFDSLNYLLDPADLRAAFYRIYAHTAPGGLFAFDLNSLYALSHSLFTQSSTDGPVRHDWIAYWDRESRQCRVEMQFWVTDEHTGQERHFTETHIQHAYTTGEITDWLQEAGFVRTKIYGNYGDRPPVPKSDRLLIVTEKE